MSETRELTLTDKKKLEAELAELMEAKKRVAEEIQIARGFGDLSENAEYDAAKAKEAEVYGNINRIEQILRTATFVDDSAASTDVVSLGNVVRVLDMEYDEEDEYTIVGFTEADPLKGKISDESPVGAALVGKRVGDTADVLLPSGRTVAYKVLKIGRSN